MSDALRELVELLARAAYEQLKTASTPTPQQLNGSEDSR